MNLRSVVFINCTYISRYTATITPVDSAAVVVITVKEIEAEDGDEGRCFLFCFFIIALQSNFNAQIGNNFTVHPLKTNHKILII